MTIPQHEQMSTSVTLPDESSSKPMMDTDALVVDLQNAAVETIDVSLTGNSISNTDSFPEAMKTQDCLELEKAESQGTEDITPLAKESDNLESDISNETESSVEDSSFETETQPSKVITADSDLLDSSTSQEEASETNEESSEDVKSDVQLTEVEKIDKATPEPEHSDIPMEVDIVTEPESKDTDTADEPSSSTSIDINL